VRFSNRFHALSLRFKYAPLVALAVLAPMLAYMVADAWMERRSILQNRLEVLQRMGDLLVEEIAGDQHADLASSRGLLARFAQRQPQLEIMVLDDGGVVLASTHPERIGRSWDEEQIQRVLAGDTQFAWALGEHEGLPVLDVTLPAQPGSSAAAVHIAEPQQRLEQESLRTLLRGALFSLLLLVLVTGMVNLVTQRLVLRRLRRIAEGLRDSEWLPADAEQPAGDELHTLSRALDTMMSRIERTTGQLRATLAERQELVERVERFNEELSAQVQATRDELQTVQEELLRKERLTVLGELTAGLAHEIRNPLQIIRGTAETVRRRNPRNTQALDDVIEEVARMDQLVRELLDYARPLDLQLEELQLLPLLRRAMEEVRRAGCDAHTQLKVPEDLRCMADETLLYRVLVNLLSNASEALPDCEGEIEIRGEQGKGGFILLEILDNGDGIHPEDLERVFEPFFSRKEAGIGMGLPLSRRIVEQHGGRLELSSELGEGTQVSLLLPAR